MENPYVPAATPPEPVDAVDPPAGSSGWARNAKACFGVTAGYVVIVAACGLLDVTASKVVLMAVSVAGAFGSAWANLPLGSKIGWSRGGLPVVIVAFFAALVGYLMIALTMGAFVYSWLAIF